MSSHYVNNAKLLEAFKQFKADTKAAREAGLEDPRIPEYIGECILKIATHLSYKINFINYSFREDMISDGIENCMVRIQNFDPERGSNPFSYFTQVIYFAFLRRIEREKKQTALRGKLIMDMPFDSFELQDHDDDVEFTNAYMAFIQAHQNFDDAVFKKKEKAKVEEKQALENFFEEGASNAENTNDQIV